MMRANEQRGGPIIILSFVIAVILTMMPVPAWAVGLGPHWVLMVLVYWSMAVPNRIGVGVAWILGLYLDVAYDALLGQHALALAVVIFLTLNVHQRLRVFPIWQQSIVIFVFCIIYNVINLWIKGISGVAPSVWNYVLIPSFTTALIWPLAFMLMRHARRFYRVA
jgi:rod shape-determining protein MreD